MDRREFFKAIGRIGAGPPLAFAAGSAEAAPGTRHHWAMVVDLRRCIGCEACTIACTMENRPPENEFRTIVSTYEVAQTDRVDMVMLPRLCNHCDDPPCVPVCPVGATFKAPDGEVLIDADRCVGCGYCVQACPYDARFLNNETGTADKCTFCAHRLQAGLLPACVETCVGGARVFGDLADPKSEVSRLLAENRSEVRVLKPEQNTHPNVFYIGLDPRFAGRVDGTPTLWRPTREKA
jgi:tetrathionate reductase subunit B